MAFNPLRWGRFAATAAVAGLLAGPSPAYLYWKQPALKGAPVIGNEPDIVIVLPDATDKEMKANLLLGLRAGLNVAALQCSVFAPGLMTAGNYNKILKEHDTEFDTAMALVQNYFKRTVARPTANSIKAPNAAAKPVAAKGKKAAAAPAPMMLYDQYMTRTYNSFSTLHAQLSFCDTAGAIGREALATPDGHLTELAVNRMREFRNSLIPVGDAGLNPIPAYLQMAPLPEIGCRNKKGKPIACPS